MAWAIPNGSPRMSYHPKPLSWIVVLVGALAFFLSYASWVLVSSPVGDTVRGYFYGVNRPEKLGFPVTPINENSVDPHLNKGLDPAGTSDSTIEQTDTRSDSQVDLIKSISEKFPITKEVNGTSDIPVSNTLEPLTSLGNSVDAANSSRLAKENLQTGLASGTTMPVAAGTDSSNVTDSIRTEEPTSEALINQPSHVITAPDEISVASDNSASTTVPASVEKPNNTANAGSVNSDCDLYHGNWIHDPSGPLYTNNTCPIITQMQNCQGNGRPDSDYENWRWKPFQCDIPRFDPKKFLELMRGKTLAFVGDSVARNQMESMLCILWQVETPKNRGNRNMQRYYFRSTSTMIVRFWSSWLVKVTNEPLDFAPAGVSKLHLDVPDPKLMENIMNFDVVILSSGHWFAKQSAYVLNNEIVGGQLWWPDQSRKLKVNSLDAFGISVETTLTAIATLPNYTGIAIVRSYSPDHYEGGEWNTGGSCTGKVKPLELGKKVTNEHTNEMHEKQITGFNRAKDKATNRAKLRLMDITDAFEYRHDGHPGPYRSPDPNKITKRGPDGKPPPQDCLHWCMPGPVDTWNELILEVIKREYEGGSAS